MYGLGGISSFGGVRLGRWRRFLDKIRHNNAEEPADVKAGRTHPNPLCDTYLCSSPYACSKEAPMIDLGHLRNRPIILKMTGMSRAIKADVVCEEKEGVWFSGEALMSVLAETGLPVAMKTPAISRLCLPKIPFSGFDQCNIATLRSKLATISIRQGQESRRAGTPRPS